MADAPRAQPVVVDGQELVAVSGEDFERLLAIRRQVGGQNARIRALTATLGNLVTMLDDIDGAVAELHGITPARAVAARGARHSPRCPSGSGRPGVPLRRGAEQAGPDEQAEQAEHVIVGPGPRPADDRDLHLRQAAVP